MQLKCAPSDLHHLCVDPVDCTPLISASGASLVAKNGVSLSITILWLTIFLGAGKWTISPSSTCNNSHQGIREGFQRKSFNQTILACAADTVRLLAGGGGDKKISSVPTTFENDCSYATAYYYLY